MRHAGRGSVLEGPDTERLAEVVEASLERVTQNGQRGVASRSLLGLTDRHSEPGTGSAILGAGTHASFLSASAQDGNQPQTGPHGERANALGAPNLVSGDCDQVRPLPRASVDLPERLHRVDVQQGPDAMGELGDVGDRLEDPRLVVDRLEG